MKTKRSFHLSRLIWTVILFVFFQGCVSLPVSPPGTKPVITDAFINKEKGIYGSVLKIYLKAEDPKGSMFKIFTVVDQVGYGRYFPDTIYVEPPCQHDLKGYLQWNTFSFRAARLPEWTQITIQVSVTDTGGNESNTVVFPFEFVSEAVPESPLPSPFNQGNIPRLGYLNINLVNPFEREDEEHRFRKEP